MSQHHRFSSGRLAGHSSSSACHISCKNGLIESLSDDAHDAQASSSSGVLIPSLCHPHIHLDKCFLLTHPKYADLEVVDGSFDEAMRLTGKAKARFAVEDLLERGRALIEESIGFGVTHMRAFVEVDFVVRMKCLDAGLVLKEEFAERCYVQICVFAQDPVFGYGEGGDMTGLLLQAVARPGVEVLGSTPYVEGSVELLERNMEWTVRTALDHGLHLDFHLDYNLDPDARPSIWTALELLHKNDWIARGQGKTVVFGHCSRLTLFDGQSWRDLKKAIGDLPVAFVGLPTSDLFMMGRPAKGIAGSNRVRGTLQVLEMLQEYQLNVAIGVNNVGNAFTPQGTCDPLSLASLGVGIYQAGTKKDAELLLQCVSSRAKAVIGLGPDSGGILQIGGPADFVIIGGKNPSAGFRDRKTIQDVVYDAGFDRSTVFRGRVVSP